MSTAVILTLCSLLLIAYLFDLSFSKTKIPSVILLLLLGWGVKQATVILNLHLPDFSAILPILGTIGLILIVLEGSLDLKISKNKVAYIRKSFIGAFFTMFFTAILIAYLFHYIGGYPLRHCLINAIPFSIISSAIAISSAKNLHHTDKEFIVYESSLSDILGVLFFNFILLNNDFGWNSFGFFGVQMLIITVISFIATIGLAFLLRKTVHHHIKFIPIILLIILIYGISEIYHLPALVFILVFGLFVGNIDKLKQFSISNRIRLGDLEKEIRKFQELISEGTFLIRALFFLLFGYLLETAEILNTDTLFWSLGIVCIIFIFRAIQLKMSKLHFRPLLYIAPRGLITILLFLSIGPAHQIQLVNRSIVIQVIVLTALIMMFGLMISDKADKREQEEIEKQEEIERQKEREQLEEIERQTQEEIGNLP